MDEVLPLLKQKYVVPRFEGIADVQYTIYKARKRETTFNKVRKK